VISEPEAAPDVPAPSAPKGRYVPAILDAIVPGLGHFVAGRRRRALVFAIPVIALLVGLVVILATTSLPRLAATLIDSDVLVAILVTQGLVLLWRLVAVGSSLTDPRLPRPTRRDALPIAALLLVVIVAPQAYAGYATQAAREAADEVFVEPSPTPVAVGPTATPEPDPSFLTTPTPTASASATPSPTPTVPRINALLIGVDSAANRNTYLTDTMIVASLDPVTETVSMISIPRDMVDVPLLDGRTYTAKVNGLVSYVRHHARQFPGSDGTGFDVLRGALGELLGLKIDYHAVVNLPGFVSVIDRLGGINVNVARAFCDPTRHGYGYERGFSITAGRHHLDGAAALAYARARKAAGESDFTRAARQQEILTGIRDRLVSGGFVNDPVGLMKALSRTISTNVPRKILPDLADGMSRIGRGETYRAVITSPLVRSRLDQRGSVQIPDVKRIRKLADAVFPPAGTLPDERYLAPKKQSGTATSGGIGNCARPATPKPTVKPTPKPTPKPTGTATPTATAEPTAGPTPEPTPPPTTAPTPPPTPAPTPEPTPTP
jgi:polyisoprenyl-teichoic acid--peptidoglycan teichoic acid transferase